MKRRSFFSLLVVGVVVLLSIGIGGCGWTTARNPLPSSNQTTPVAAMFVPRQAPVIVSLLVNPDNPEVLRQVAPRAREQKRWGTQLNQLKTSLLANTGLDYRRDVQPWLGNEMTLAVTAIDIDRNSENGQQPGYLMALATKDANKSREFLQLLFSKRTVAGKGLVFEQYEGVQLIHEDSQQQLNGISAAVVSNDFVLFANHPKVLRDAINNVQASGLNLTSSSQYQQALNQLPTGSIGWAFLNLPQVAAWRRLKLQPLYESQIIALELKRQGLLAETSLRAAPDQEISPPAPTLAQPVEALRYMPSATGFSIVGADLSRLRNTDLNQLWTQVTGGRSSSGYDAVSKLITQPLAVLQANWGIDLQKDIFSWVQGEYALGLVPHADQTAADWIFVAEKSNTAPAEISRLDELAQQQGLSITSLPVGDQNISAWTKLITTPVSLDSDRASLTLKAKVYGVHATVGKYEILTTSVEAMDAALKAPSLGSLIDNPKFQASSDAIPQPNEGYVYLDWTETQKILEHQLPILRLLEAAVQPFFSNLRSLTVSSYGSDTGLLKGGIFFQLND